MDEELVLIVDNDAKERGKCDRDIQNRCRLNRCSSWLGGNMLR